MSEGELIQPKWKKHPFISSAYILKCSPSNYEAQVRKNHFDSWDWDVWDELHISGRPKRTMKEAKAECERWLKIIEETRDEQR